MAKMHTVEGYDNFCKFIEELNSGGEEIFVLFSGSKLASGESWCIDCVHAHPNIQASLKFLPPKSHFVHCDVGDRSYWKNLKCPFRTDRKINICVLPTIKKWNTQHKLEGSQCGKLDLLEMLFTEGDE